MCLELTRFIDLPKLLFTKQALFEAADSNWVIAIDLTAGGVNRQPDRPPPRRSDHELPGKR